ncbi:hypothetical protein SSX86_018840 [Deinandra increscens subsp. villosa]|uniref:Uncharacterized protein n=1 Tax=Deinandra increscens subsp. villosa TaxID=3103831 RepID=A0AAP0CWN7_9ASTR
MENRWILVALCLPLIVISFIRPSEAKELRPSDHGLPDEARAPETAQAKSPEMSSFFGDGGTQSLPEARNISEPSWEGRREGGGADHVRKALVVSGLVCGIAGIVLLVVAGFLFVSRHRSKRSSVVLSS